jgi:hypothetical protein
MPFQSDEIVCPLAKAQVSDQLVIAVVPVFWIVMAAPNALEFCGCIVYRMLHAVGAATALGAKRVRSRAASTVKHPATRE